MYFDSDIVRGFFFSVSKDKYDSMNIVNVNNKSFFVV